MVLLKIACPSERHDEIQVAQTLISWIRCDQVVVTISLPLVWCDVISGANGSSEIKIHIMCCSHIFIECSADLRWNFSRLSVIVMNGFSPNGDRCCLLFSHLIIIFVTYITFFHYREFQRIQLKRWKFFSSAKQVYHVYKLLKKITLPMDSNLNKASNKSLWLKLTWFLNIGKIAKMTSFTPYSRLRTINYKIESKSLTRKIWRNIYSVRLTIIMWPMRQRWFNFVKVQGLFCYNIWL